MIHSMDFQCDFVPLFETLLQGSEKKFAQNKIISFVSELGIYFCGIFLTKKNETDFV